MLVVLCKSRARFMFQSVVLVIVNCRVGDVRVLWLSKSYTCVRYASYSAGVHAERKMSWSASWPCSDPVACEADLSFWRWVYAVHLWRRAKTLLTRMGLHVPCTAKQVSTYSLRLSARPSGGYKRSMNVMITSLTTYIETLICSHRWLFRRQVPGLLDVQTALLFLTSLTSKS